MARCAQKFHEGNREITRTTTFIRGGVMHEGCRACIEPMLSPLYSTEKRLVVSKGTGKHYWISAAHRRDIQMRRVVPDSSGDSRGQLSKVYRDRRGRG